MPAILLDNRARQLAEHLGNADADHAPKRTIDIDFAPFTARAAVSAPRHWFAGFIVTLALSAAHVVRAESAAGALAREHFRAGVIALEANDFEAALSAFRAAYALEKCPEVQVTIAAVEERRARFQAAIEALQRYLELAPQGVLADTARARIDELESKLLEETSVAAGSEAVAASEAPDPSPDTRPSLEPAQAFSLPPPIHAPARPLPDAALADAPTTQRRSPVIRLPAFIALGVGGLGASGALATGLIVNGRYNDPSNCTHRCDDGHAISSRALTITSGVLAGVAAAGIGAGVVLLLTKPAHSERSRLVPALRLKVSAEKAAAGAVWRF
jgi:tetratricopeptide (TPR) repeat protein